MRRILPSLLDRYIIRKFLITYLFVFALFMAIAIVIDVSEKLDDFMESSATAGQIIGEYYLSFIPYMGAILTPIFIFIAVIFFTSKMAYDSEIVAMLSSGISFNRFLRPYLLTSLLLSGLMLYANHWLVPRANKVRLDFEVTYLKGERWYADNIHIRLDPMTFMYLNRFKFQRSEGVDFTLERYKTGPRGKELKYRINSRTVQYLKDTDTWRLRDWNRWEIDDLRETYTQGSVFDTSLALVPDDLELRVFLKEAMDYRELQDFLVTERAKGTPNLEFYEVEHNRRTSSSLSIFILTLIGASVASRKVRGGIGLHIAFGFAVSALYILFLQFSSTLSTNADVPAWIGTNVPNVIFGIFCLYLIRWTPK